ncbi:ParB/RepB/Spo0J family partition protein [Longicatena caecimuris]|uniref:ParB/RepB/Spo0J family partition protein n=1 Tax=Longicatena caecimuris TaxID=1796635 RepID=UPI0022E7AF89|nr:ParB/RepB/Spo0J family partition protein [Longicatena caecimuris]
MDKVMAIKVKDLQPFPDNPFRISNGMEMEMLIQSVKDFGIITPLVVRPMEDKFEIISGHRRWQAAQKAGIEVVPAFVREMSRDAAVVALVDCNLQPEHLLPSEKGFAYKMKLEAMKRQGFRTDLTSAQVGQRLTSVGLLAEQSADSRVQIQRYIRLTSLEKPLLDLVDEGRISLTPAVELSYLPPDKQNELIETIESEDCTPSLSQAQRMRRLNEQGALDMDKIFEIMTEVKGNQTEVLKVPTDRIRRYFKPNTTPKQMEDTIVKALEYYYRKLQRERNDAR